MNETMQNKKTYYFMDMDEGIVRKTKYVKGTIDEERIRVGNAFKTREEAEDALRKTLRILRNQKDVKEPKELSLIYYVNAYGNVIKVKYRSRWHKKLLEYGNVFTKKTEAEEAAARVEQAIQNRKTDVAGNV